MRNSAIRLHVRAQGKQSPTAILIDHGELSARRKRPETGIWEVLVADHAAEKSGTRRIRRLCTRLTLTFIVRYLNWQAHNRLLGQIVRDGEPWLNWSAARWHSWTLARSRDLSFGVNRRS